MLQSMVQVTEFGLQSLAEILPSTYAKLGPILVCHGSLPGQGLSHQQGNSHLDNLGCLYHTCHLAKLLDVKCPVYQLPGIAIILLQLLQFNIGAC